MPDSVQASIWQAHISSNFSTRFWSKRILSKIQNPIFLANFVCFFFERLVDCEWNLTNETKPEPETVKFLFKDAFLLEWRLRYCKDLWTFEDVFWKVRLSTKEKEFFTIRTFFTVCFLKKLFNLEKFVHSESGILLIMCRSTRKDTSILCWEFVVICFLQSQSWFRWCWSGKYVAYSHLKSRIFFAFWDRLSSTDRCKCEECWSFEDVSWLQIRDFGMFVFTQKVSKVNQTIPSSDQKYRKVICIFVKMESVECHQPSSGLELVELKTIFSSSARNSTMVFSHSKKRSQQGMFPHPHHKSSPEDLVGRI